MNYTDNLPMGEFIKKKGIEFLNLPISFDIESSSFYDDNGDKVGLMYLYAVAVGDSVHVGRTWSDFIRFIRKIIDMYSIDITRRAVIYVHNLSYEFQFIKKLFQWDEIKCVQERKILKAVTKDGIEFRCSYLLSGYNLDTVAKNLHNHKILKMVGDLDYNLIRTPATPITAEEMRYMINDVLIVTAYIEEEIKKNGDITKIPTTKTGYVRKEFRESIFISNDIPIKTLMRRLTLTDNDYKQLKRAFQGGFTHANAKHVDKTIKDVVSVDLCSAYPSVMVSEKFPMSKFFKVDKLTFYDFNKYIHTCACLFDITIDNVTPKFTSDYYISYSKCYNIENFILNNGRVMEADTLSMTVTEIDYKIICKTYNFDHLKIRNFKYAFKDYLPAEVLNVVLRLYSDKTTLKNVEGYEVEYMSSKENLNSCYGMIVTDIVKDDITYDEHGDYTIEAPILSEKITEYNKKNGRFLFYPWGVWVTAYNRYNLWSAILECNDDYIYSDTDSVKCINFDKHKDFFEMYNRIVSGKVNRCLKYNGIEYAKASPCDKNGIKHPIGVFEKDGEYKYFKTCGAKRYIYSDGESVNITIAGVGKTAGKEYLKYKYKTVEKIFKAFTDTLEFPAEYSYHGEKKSGTGKLTHTYIESPRVGSVVDYMGKVYEYNVSSSVHLENAPFKLSLSEQFKRILEGYRE